MKSPEIGQVYYEVAFADPDLKIPHVIPYRYLGKDLFPEHQDAEGTKYYFGHPAMVSEGSGENQAETEFYLCSEEGLSGFYTLPEAVAKLALVAAGVDLTRPPGSRGMNL